MRYTPALWGWELRERFLAFARYLLPRQRWWWLHHRGRRGRARRLIAEIMLMAADSGQTGWNISPQGCEFGDDVYDRHLAAYERAEIERPETEPDDSLNLPLIGEWLEARRRRNAKRVEKDIAVERARKEAIRRFEPGDWELVVTRLWRMSSGTLSDRLLFRPATQGQGRTIEFVISRKPYTWRLDIGPEAVGCTLEPQEEIEDGEFSCENVKNAVPVHLGNEV